MHLIVPENSQNLYSEAQGWQKVIFDRATSVNYNGNTYQVIGKREKYHACCSLTRLIYFIKAIFYTVVTCGKAPHLSNLWKGKDEVTFITLNASVVQKPLLSAAPKQRGVAIEHKWASKFFEVYQEKSPPVFTSLTQAQLEQLLDKEPELKFKRVFRDRATAFNFIQQVHSRGIPGVFTDEVNKELIRQMQFILWDIQQKKDVHSQKKMLLELAEDLMDCSAVCQGNINKRYMNLLKMGGFEENLERFVLLYKERIFDQTLCELYPNMATSQNLASHEQFPHRKAAFLSVLGDEIGLSNKAASKDKDRDLPEANWKKQEFLRKFQGFLLPPEFVKEFVTDVNGSYGQLDVKQLAEWCGKALDNRAHDIYYNEELQYPSYSPAFTKAREYQPYLTEEIACLILVKAGLLKSA